MEIIKIGHLLLKRTALFYVNILHVLKCLYCRKIYPHHLTLQRDQLDQKEQLVASLRKQLQDTTSQERSSNQLRKLREENQVLMAQNARLKETNLCLSEEAHRLQQHSEQLQQVWMEKTVFWYGIGLPINTLN